MTSLVVSAALAALPNVDDPVATGATSPADVAVVVGISDYANLADLPDARRDAEAIAAALVRTRGLAPERVRLVTDGASVPVIRGEVERAGREAGAGATVWVYLSGHGAASLAHGERMVLGQEASPMPEYFDKGGVTLQELARLAATGGGRPLIIVDACFTAQARDGAALTTGRPAIPVYAQVPPNNAIVWTATAPGEVAASLAGTGHGAFTWAVLGALRGWADGEKTKRRDGAVTLDEAQAFVRRALPSLQQRAQSPTLEPGGADLALVLGVRERAPALGPGAATVSIGAAVRPLAMDVSVFAAQEDGAFTAAPAATRGGKITLANCGGVQFDVVVDQPAYIYTAYFNHARPSELVPLWPSWESNSGVASDALQLSAGALTRLPTPPAGGGETYLRVDTVPGREELFLVASTSPLSRASLAHAASKGASELQFDGGAVRRLLKGMNVATTTHPMENRALVRAAPGEPAVFALDIEHVPGVARCKDGTD